MLDHTKLRKGVRIIIDGQPYEILESMPLKKAQRRVVIQTKIKNLITGNVFDRNFHQGDVFEEAELVKFQAKFLYSHPIRKSSISNGAGRDKFVFCEAKNPSKRFELTKEQIGNSAKFLKPNQTVESLVFDEKMINISLPIKIQLLVKETSPGVKGDTAQGGTKIAILETGAETSVPLFIEQGDLIEINTEKGEYVRRIEKK